MTGIALASGLLAWPVSFCSIDEGAHAIQLIEPPVTPINFIALAYSTDTMCVEN